MQATIKMPAVKFQHTVDRLDKPSSYTIGKVWHSLLTCGGPPYGEHLVDDG